MRQGQVYQQELMEYLSSKSPQIEKPAILNTTL